MELFTNSLNLALAGRKIVHEMTKGKKEKGHIEKPVMFCLVQSLAAFLFTARVVLKTEKKRDRKKPGLFQEEIRCTEKQCM